VLELVADQPELVAGLEVVARRGLSAQEIAARQEARVEVLDRGPGRNDAGPEGERDD